MSNVTLLRSIIKTLAFTSAPLITLVTGSAYASPDPSTYLLDGVPGVVASQDGAGSGAFLANPQGILSTGDGNLLFVEAGDGYILGGRVRAVDASTFQVTSVAGDGAFATVDSGDGAAGSFGQLAHIAADPTTPNVYYVTQSNDGALRQVTLSSGPAVIQTLATDDAASAGVATRLTWADASTPTTTIYTTGANKPLVRVRNSDGSLDHVIPYPDFGRSDDCIEDGTTPSTGLALVGKYLFVGCGVHVFRVDLSDGEAVMPFMNFIPLNGLHASDSGTLIVLSGHYLMEIDPDTRNFLSFTPVSDTVPKDVVRVTGVASARAAIQQVPTEECASGSGVVILTGNDKSDAVHTFATGADSTLRVVGRVFDGVLDPDEVTASTVLCNGVDGVGAVSRQFRIEANELCPYGGIELQVGVDYNHNHVLDNEEVDGEATQFVCDGAPGERGDTGAPGSNGADGADGSNGTDGINGIDGIDGTNGVNGTNGTNGADGADGATGPAGPAGPTGPAGSDGVNGVDGASGNGCAAVDARDSGVLGALLGLVFLRRRKSR